MIDPQQEMRQLGLFRGTLSDDWTLDWYEDHARFELDPIGEYGTTFAVMRDEDGTFTCYHEGPVDVSFASGFPTADEAVLAMAVACAKKRYYDTAVDLIASVTP